MFDRLKQQYFSHHTNFQSAFMDKKVDTEVVSHSSQELEVKTVTLLLKGSRYFVCYNDMSLYYWSVCI